jgi:predicted DNA-binding transcriptional regulator YafY
MQRAFDYMSRDERLHIMMNVLRSRGAFGRDEMIDQLEISHPTFKRDLEFLRSRFQADIEYDANEKLYRLATADQLHGLAKKGNKVELAGLWFSQQELQALLSMYVLLDGYGAQAVLGPHLAPFKDRIQNLLGKNTALDNQLRSRIRILPMASRKPSEHFPQLAHAVLTRKRVHLHYASRARGDQTERVVSPQRLVHYRDNWYLDAYCHLRERLSTFSVDAILKIKPLKDAAVEISEDELEGTLAGGYGIFSGKATHTAVLRFSAERSRWVSGETWHPDQKGEWDGQEWRLTFPYSDPRELLMDILRHGSHVKVESPHDLREMVKAEHRKSLDI